jgi:predicted metal-dependent hydrolase
LGSRHIRAKERRVYEKEILDGVRVRVFLVLPFKKKETMKKIISLNGEQISYTLKRHPRSKGVRLSVSGECALTVTAPRWVPNYFIERAVKEKEDWILQTFAHFAGKIPPSRLNLNRGALYEKHKEEARGLVVRRLEHFNRFYGLSWNKISIRDQKTRWGSCSKKKNLNFHYKLALVPASLADYVVVHELCHLKEFNHSKKFWELVALAIPDHQARRKELREYRL